MVSAAGSSCPAGAVRVRPTGLMCRPVRKRNQYSAPGRSPVSSTCTECADTDTRADGVTCDEIAAYNSFGPVAA